MLDKWKGTQIQNMSYKLKRWGFYTQGDDQIESRYNHYSEEKDSFNNSILPSIEKMPDNERILSSKHNRPLFPVNDTKMHDDEHMPAKKHKR